MDESDADWICEMLGDPRVTRLLQFLPKDREQFLEKHRMYLALEREPGPVGAFVLEDNGVRAGYGFLRRYEWEPEYLGVLEIGYLIAPSFWHKGIATALTSFLLRRAARERILALIDDRNIWSQKTVQRAGFRRIGGSAKYAGNSLWEKASTG